MSILIIGHYAVARFFYQTLGAREISLKIRIFPEPLRKRKEGGYDFFRRTLYSFV